MISLTILGSSSALPLSNRYPSSQFLRISERQFLIDCGEGTQMQLRKNRIGFARINHIMISHLHGDHIFGLLPLLSSLHLLDRQKELNIYAPAELEANIHTNLQLSKSQLKYPLIFHALEAKESATIFEDKAVLVKSFPLKHSINCWGFSFIEKPKPRKVLGDKVAALGIVGPEVKRIQNGDDWVKSDGSVVLNSVLTEDPEASVSYMYCSDTAPVRNLPDLVGLSPSLLYHEATFMESHKGRAKQTKHSTAAQAAEIALQLGADELIIGHFSTRYHDLKPLLQEAQETFPSTHLAEDNWTYVLKSGKKLEKEYKL